MNFQKLKTKCMKFRFKYFEKTCDPYYFTRILKQEGIAVGDHTIFYDPKSQTIDRERVWMLEIGDFCKITKGTVILTHDYSRSVLRRVYGDVIGEAGKTVIGNNVFIGMNSVILMGTHIGNNVIVGAGSVVSGNIPDNCVVAGNPAKVIRTLEQHYEIRKAKSIDEAKLFARSYKEKYKKWPDAKTMDCFFPLYMPRNEEILRKNGIHTKLNGDDEHDIIQCFLRSEPYYEDYESFLKACEDAEQE